MTTNHANSYPRINNEGETNPIEDNFPNENLFIVPVKSPWSLDITNYLSTRKLPSHLSSREKHKIIKTGTLYSWIQNDSFILVHI